MIGAESFPAFLEVPVDERKEESNSVVEIHIGLVIAAPYIEHLNIEDIIENDSEQRPNGREMEVIAVRICFDFPPEHPKGNDDADGSYEESDHRFRYDEEEDDAEQVADEPED